MILFAQHLIHFCTSVLFNRDSVRDPRHDQRQAAGGDRRPRLRRDVRRQGRGGDERQDLAGWQL